MEAPYTGHHYRCGLLPDFMALILDHLSEIHCFTDPISKMLFGNILCSVRTKTRVEYEQAFSYYRTGSMCVSGKFKKILKKKEDKLGNSFGNLSDQFTFTNILQTVGRNLYNSFVTTANITRTAFNLFKRFSRKKHKVSKKKKRRRPEIEENNS